MKAKPVPVFPNNQKIGTKRTKLGAKKVESTLVKPVFKTNSSTAVGTVPVQVMTKLKKLKSSSSKYINPHSPRPIPISAVTTKFSIKETHYLGMKPTDEDVGELLNRQVFKAISRIEETYPSDKLSTMRDALENGVLEEYGWSLPSKPYHITSFLINGKATTKNKKAMEEFKIGIEEKLDINCIIVVEDMFVATLVKPRLVDVNAKIPYMALWLNGSKPKDCNNVLEHILYQIKPSIKHGEERLRAYYAIIEKSKLKNDVVGEIDINFDKYKKKKIWYCFIKDSNKIAFETFIKKIGDEE
jgi:hypothetical protein